MTLETDSTGDALFGTSPGGFAWATGIEDTFIGQTERIGERVLDEYALTHHYLYWRDDIDRAADLGVRAMRYGIPWYKVEPAPGRFDWEWVDRVLEYIASKGITIIVDLMHYGTPSWLDNQFLNAAYSERVADYAAEFTRRYKHLVSHYAPLNEPWVTVLFCGEYGIWPPYLRGEDGAVKILASLARGIVRSVEAIREANPNAVIMTVDAADEPMASAPGLEEIVQPKRERAYITTDLITGKVTAEHPLCDWLLQHGMTEAALAWHAGRAIDVDIVGVNYYPETSVRKIKESEGLIVGQPIWGGTEGLERAVRGFARRYGKPVMITETSTNGNLELREQWLLDSIAAVSRLRREGIPLVGYTWWPLFDLIDWSYRAGARPIEEFMARLGPPKLDIEHISELIARMGWNRLEQLPLEAYIAPMGLYELRMQFDGTFGRVHTPLVDLYKAAISKGLDS